MRRTAFDTFSANAFADESSATLVTSTCSGLDSTQTLTFTCFLVGGRGAVDA